MAIVTLADKRGDAGATVLRDYADIANPTTVCRGVSWNTRLLDARHLWTFGCGETGEGFGCAFAVVDLPEAVYHWYRMPIYGEDGGTAAALASDLQTMAFQRYDEAGARELHVADVTGDHLVFRFPTPDGRCGSPLDSNIAAFSRSGDYLYYLDQSIPERFTLVVVGGHDVLFTIEPPEAGWPDGGWPMMALWSSVADTLYYRQGSDVYEWTPAGGKKRVLKGVPWLEPTMTPDGRHLVFALATTDGNHDIYLATMPDLTSAKRIARNRNHPVFLNNRQLWYRSERSAGCGGSESPTPLVYNMRSGDESASILFDVQYVWPATSSNH